MKVIFGTTNERKVKDFQHIIEQLHFNIELLSLSDIECDQGEIVEVGTTIEEISLHKAKDIFRFLKKRKFNIQLLQMM